MLGYVQDRRSSHDHLNIMPRLIKISVSLKHHTLDRLQTIRAAEINKEQKRVINVGLESRRLEQTYTRTDFQR